MRVSGVTTEARLIGVAFAQVPKPFRIEETFYGFDNLGRAIYFVEAKPLLKPANKSSKKKLSSQERLKRKLLKLLTQKNRWSKKQLQQALSYAWKLGLTYLTLRKTFPSAPRHRLLRLAKGLGRSVSRDDRKRIKVLTKKGGREFDEKDFWKVFDHYAELKQNLGQKMASEQALKSELANDTKTYQNLRAKPSKVITKTEISEKLIEKTNERRYDVKNGKSYTIPYVGFFAKQNNSETQIEFTQA